MNSMTFNKKETLTLNRPLGETLLRKMFSAWALVFIWVGMAVVASIISPVFLTSINLSNILNQASILGILACAQFLVVLVGGFDLSVAAILALSSVIFASVVPVSTGLGMALGCMAGAALGLLSGVAVTWGRVPPMIATLSVMGIARGLAFVVSEKSVAVPMAKLGAFKFSVSIISLPVLTWLIAGCLLYWMLKTLRFGRNLYAIGGNERAATLAGIGVKTHKIVVYTLAGGLSALAGLMLVVRTSSGVPHVGQGWELDSIAAIVIGGTRLFGGEGNILKAMMGVLIYQTIANVMNLAGLDPFYQDIVKALVIITVVGATAMRAEKV
ncbi:ABC transporter permease [Klebsiella pneumoniae]|uniref:ABC transporter permease n=1 Tax=Klebsiella pneumoniae TaxID=573 RepID=UPI0019BAC775|nr:ABC transporter permease [Klebsiella pneumoniae]MBD7163926.1 ABC transporter permease [Klebsiella pneumoniae]MBL9535879.1 ABC transporter permease [Klebsiella pneumoniae]MBZ1552174.1 ABC transporter permease [Klebsiella pneumoniae]HBR2829007.1 ABC transporter permease [Klebsiella pneumoniae]HBT9008045.1 ABC transporter permease [Klebsiella pneumoniae]